MAASSAFVNVGGVRALRVKEFIDKVLPKKCYVILQAILPRVTDERLRALKRISRPTTKNDTSATYDAISLTQSKEINALTLTKPIYSDEMFGQIAHDLFNQLFMNIFQAEVRDKDKEKDRR